MSFNGFVKSLSLANMFCFIVAIAVLWYMPSTNGRILGLALMIQLALTYTIGIKSVLNNPRFPAQAPTRLENRSFYRRTWGGKVVVVNTVVKVLRIAALAFLIDDPSTRPFGIVWGVISLTGWFLLWTQDPDNRLGRRVGQRLGIPPMD